MGYRFMQKSTALNDVDNQNACTGTSPVNDGDATFRPTC